MAEDQGRQRGEADGREHVTEVLGDPQISSLPSATSTSPRTKTASAATSKKPGYYSGRGYLKDLPRHERRRIEREIRKRRKPGESSYEYNYLLISYGTGVMTFDHRTMAFTYCLIAQFVSLDPFDVRGYIIAKV